MRLGGLGQHLREQLLRQFGVAEEGLEHFAEHADVLLAAHQHGFERGAQVVLALHAHDLRGGDRAGDARAVHRHTGAAQCAAEGSDVVRKFSGARVPQDHDEALRSFREPAIGSASAATRPRLRAA
ncbi:hypothetical protein FQZ97_1139780 [compost metagenome]